jgi:glycosyltransferase involved in cell wall biosynthesis
MRILYIVTRGDVIGGASMHVLELAEDMQRRGCDVTILLGPGDIVAQLAQQRGLTFIVEPLLLRQISPWHDLRCLLRLSRLLRQIKPDLVHLHSAKAGILGRIVARLHQIPAVYSVHGWSFSMFQGAMARWFQRIERALLPLTDLLVLVCQRDIRIAVDILGAKPTQVHLVHNGIADLPAAGLTTESATCRLISVARFEQPKDQATLLRALAQLPVAGWQLQLVGDGPMLEPCRQLALELGVTQVEFLGERADVADLLAQSDVFVLSSKSESLPVSVLEAMRASLPVVATNVGGMGELVEEGASGYLVEPQSTVGLSQRLAELIKDPSLRRRMGTKARERYLQHFTLQQNGERLFNLYLQLLEAA